MLDILSGVVARALCTHEQKPRVVLDDRGPYGIELRDTQNPQAWLTYQSGPTSPIPSESEAPSMATRDNPVHPTGQPRFSPEQLTPQDLSIILNNLHKQADDHQAMLDIAEARDTLDELHGTRAFKSGPVMDAMDSVQRAQVAASRESVRADLRGVSDALTSILNELVTRGDVE